jgi:hypothetical protein
LAVVSFTMPPDAPWQAHQYPLDRVGYGPHRRLSVRVTTPATSPGGAGNPPTMARGTGCRLPVLDASRAHLQTKFPFAHRATGNFRWHGPKEAP